MAWGRVALVLAAEKAGHHLDDVAATFGFVRDDRPDHAGKKKNNIPQKEVEDSDNIILPPTRTLFWRIQSVTHLKKPESNVPEYLEDPSYCNKRQEAPSGTYMFDLPSPASTLAALVPLLFNTLGREFTSSRLDDKKLTKLLSQARPITRLPRKRQVRWPRLLTIIVDKHKKLFPYWHDFDTIADQLTTLLGEDRVKVIDFANTIVSGPSSLSKSRQNSLQPLQPLPNSAVLFLSDLNDHGSTSRYWSWLELLDELNNQGCRMLCLSPAERSPSERHLCRLSRPCPLSSGGSAPRYPGRKGFLIPIEETEIEQALIMIAPLVLVDRGLLRKLRTTFHWGSLALEGRLWNDSRIIPGYLGIRLAAKHRQTYQNLFEKLAKEKQQRFWEIVSQHHENGYLGLKNLEAMSRAAFTGGEYGEMVEYYRSLLASLHQRCDSEDENRIMAIKQQLKTLVGVAPGAVRQENNELKELLHDVFAIAWKDEVRAGKWPQSIPEWLDPGNVAWVWPENDTVQNVRYHFLQQGVNAEALITNDVGALRAGGNIGGEILQLIGTSMHPPLIKLAGQSVQRAITGPLQLPGDVSQPVTLKTESSQWQLQVQERPHFAVKMGRDAGGLFIETRFDDLNSRVYWLPEEKTVRGKTLRGIWFPQVELSKEFGRDQYGMYRDFEVKGVSQRFRWCEPGTFLMGSPGDEPEREPWSSKETRHQVTLTRGFWLADTTVTQELWQAVMGENPSEFKGGNRPVERVSWEDVQEFLKKMNPLVPELSARLPWEAEWEYGCRAGTTTPFSFGENITTDQVNYDGNSPYNNGEKGESRGETVAAKSLPCNNWGLYEMHGNVWEWCRDYYQADLSDRPVVDPHGPETGGDCVVRGGSWLSHGGGIVRSAIRNGFDPADRFSGLGFRLARGHGVQVRAGRSREQSVPRPCRPRG